MTQRLLSLIALSVLVLAPGVRADSLSHAFARGNAAFAKGDFEAATQEYEALIELGVADPAVTFNLASAYGSLGQYGQAIRYFERTLELEPGDGGAKQGLKTARSALGERQASAHGEAIVTERPALSAALFSWVRADTLAWLVLAGVWLAALGALLLLRTRGEALRLALGISVALASTLGIVAGFGLAAKSDFGAPGHRAVILTEHASLRNGPDPSARLLQELPEGAHVRTLAHSAGYFRIRTSTGREGYVRAKAVGRI